ncbi:MAG: anthranilate phosphoribosyltransferase [candidate division Zixibacteria bacterium]|nr:anthranilate phosphoribosyltransferase [candidate division Zixibacteria bacterium]MDH3935795.1 anthranilate phosphoribosyltransferase [candidate division Zixibacteria bacterium]MDH4034639.1 anthranilate phosphoribosyltransferase [candidate division Zixibacteria bacterium]
MLKPHLQKVLTGAHLSMHEASQALDTIMDGQATPAQIAGLLIALKQKGETADEVAGFVTSMRQHAVRITLNDPAAVDGCGTGGDGAHTFNISTAAAIVTAAAGVTVAKHGNRSISSKCGSADLLEAAGGNIDPGPETVQSNINQVAFGFMFAPKFHPAMKHAAGPRKELGIRTVFNILGPMSNPAGVKRQVIGVYDQTLMPLFADVLEMTGSEHVIIAHARDGLDEFSVVAPTDYIELRGGERSRNVLEPEQVGLVNHEPDSLRGGDAAQNASMLSRLLTGEPSACRDAVVLNAGAMIYVGGKSVSIAEGVARAQSVIDNGSARSAFDAWLRASNT